MCLLSITTPRTPVRMSPRLSQRDPQDEKRERGEIKDAK